MCPSADTARDPAKHRTLSATGLDERKPLRKRERFPRIELAGEPTGARSLFLNQLKTVIEKNGDRIRPNYTVRRTALKLNSAGETGELELTLTKKPKKKARNALRSGGTAKVNGVVTATDESFNVTKQRFEIGFG